MRPDANNTNKVNKMNTNEYCTSHPDELIPEFTDLKFKNQTLKIQDLRGGFGNGIKNY
jgi:hypothetical protein